MALNCQANGLASQKQLILPQTQETQNSQSFKDIKISQTQHYTQALREVPIASNSIHLQLLVSQALSDQDLANVLREAVVYNLPVVFKGFIQEDWGVGVKDIQQRIAKLVDTYKLNKVPEVSVDPRPFRTIPEAKVPALVVFRAQDYAMSSSMAQVMNMEGKLGSVRDVGAHVTSSNAMPVGKDLLTKRQYVISYVQYGNVSLKYAVRQSDIDPAVKQKLQMIVEQKLHGLEHQAQPSLQGEKPNSLSSLPSQQLQQGQKSQGKQKSQEEQSNQLSLQSELNTQNAQQSTNDSEALQVPVTYVSNPQAKIVMVNGFTTQTIAEEDIAVVAKRKVQSFLQKNPTLEVSSGVDKAFKLSMPAKSKLVTSYYATYAQANKQLLDGYASREAMNSGSTSTSNSNQNKVSNSGKAEVNTNNQTTNNKLTKVRDYINTALQQNTLPHSFQQRIDLKRYNLSMEESTEEVPAEIRALTYNQRLQSLILKETGISENHYLKKENKQGLAGEEELELLGTAKSNGIDLDAVHSMLRLDLWFIDLSNAEVVRALEQIKLEVIQQYFTAGQRVVILTGLACYPHNKVITRLGDKYVGSYHSGLSNSSSQINQVVLKSQGDEASMSTSSTYINSSISSTYTTSTSVSQNTPTSNRATETKSSTTQTNTLTAESKTLTTEVCFVAWSDYLGTSLQVATAELISQYQPTAITQVRAAYDIDVVRYNYLRTYRTDTIKIFKRPTLRPLLSAQALQNAAAQVPPQEYRDRLIVEDVPLGLLPYIFQQ
ncbi:TrbC family F-type conjugative pilus assembly protein [Psittacicella hinzii]|uniref:TrbC family F-type conjugative pilus assembly protein n=1 Tax=Psittacicella hinzii TaxID=2028575 RepID=UPI001CA77D9A|nr:TrbC family F-type conjugative pilus assembly protein [Psittacicella hinzii]